MDSYALRRVYQNYDSDFYTFNEDTWKVYLYELRCAILIEACISRVFASEFSQKQRNFSQFKDKVHMYTLKTRRKKISPKCTSAENCLTSNLSWYFFDVIGKKTRKDTFAGDFDVFRIAGANTYSSSYKYIVESTTPRREYPRQLLRR